MRGLGIVGDPTSKLIGTTNKVAVYRIPYKETHVWDGATSTEQFTAIDAAGTKIFDLDWHWRQQAAMQILGFSWRDLDGGGKPRILRYLPEYHPDFFNTPFGTSTLMPYLTAVKATSLGVSEKGFVSINTQGVPGEDSLGGSGGGSGDAYGGYSKDSALYKSARFTVIYDFLPYYALPDPPSQTNFYAPPATRGETGADGSAVDSTGWCEVYNGNLRYISFEMKPAAEYLAVPPSVNAKDPTTSNTLKWSDSRPGSSGETNGRVGFPFPGNVGYVVGHIDYKFTWHQVPFEAIPVNTIQSLIGHVNLRSVILPGGQGITAKPGQLLLLNLDTKRTGSPYGNWLWDVEYTMRYNPRGHNNFFDYVAGGWFQASRDGGYYGYKEGAGSIFPPLASVTDYGNPPDGKLLYDSRDFNKLFTPE